MKQIYFHVMKSSALKAVGCTSSDLPAIFPEVGSGISSFPIHQDVLRGQLSSTLENRDAKPFFL
jgi:hypothetical protein